METHKIKFKAITHRGKIVNKILKIEIPDTCKTDSQILRYIDDTDNRYLMEKYEWHGIIDYWVVKPKENKTSTAEYINDIMTQAGFSGQLKVDFMASWVKMKDVIKGLPLERKMHIVLHSMDLGQLAAINAYKHVISMFDKTKNEKFIEYKENKLLES